MASAQRYQLDSPPAPLTASPSKEQLTPTAYLISVKTGNRFDAGKDATVFIQLFGKNGDSPSLALQKSRNHQTKFQPRNNDLFIFDNMASLGDLDKVKVWHENKPWHLDYIAVHDYSTGMLYRFDCNRWWQELESEGYRNIWRLFSCSDKTSKPETVQRLQEKFASVARSASSTAPPTDGLGKTVNASANPNMPTEVLPPTLQPRSSPAQQSTFPSSPTSTAPGVQAQLETPPVTPKAAPQEVQMGFWRPGLGFGCPGYACFPYSYGMGYGYPYFGCGIGYPHYGGGFGFGYPLYGHGLGAGLGLGLGMGMLGMGMPWGGWGWGFGSWSFSF